MERRDRTSEEKGGVGVGKIKQESKPCLKVSNSFSPGPESVRSLTELALEIERDKPADTFSSGPALPNHQKIQTKVCAWWGGCLKGH